MREKAKPFNVKVAVRVRPILAHDRDPRPVVRVDRESTKPSVTVVDPDKEFPGLKQNIDYLRSITSESVHMNSTTSMARRSRPTRCSRRPWSLS